MAVEFSDDFWRPRLQTNRERTLPHILEQLMKSSRFDALRLNLMVDQVAADQALMVDPTWVEAASYSLATHPDPALDARLEKMVAYLKLGQQPDGFVQRGRAVTPVEERWRDLRDGHQLCGIGHMLEAGVAHFQATGKPSLLDVCCRRLADHIAGIFGRGQGQIREYCGHEEIELALVRLYRATGEERYLRLAQYFVDERGQPPNFFEQEPGPHRLTEYRASQARMAWVPEYCQSHLPVREQTEVVGHAVRAMDMQQNNCSNLVRDQLCLWHGSGSSDSGEISISCLAF